MAQPHCVVYDRHTPVPTDPDPATALAAARAAGGMLWVGLSRPTREQVHELADVFGLEPLGVASATPVLFQDNLSHLVTISRLG